MKSKIKQQINRLFADENASIDKQVRNAASIDRGGSLDRGASIDLKLGGGGDDDAPIIRLVSAIITEACFPAARPARVRIFSD